MRKKLLFICILIFSLLMVACGAKDAPGTEGVEREPVAPEEDSTYTLMVYMIGSDLEAAGAAATNDMAEMLENQIDFSRMNVVVYTGGSPKWHSDIDGEVNGVYRMTENGFEQVTSFELASMGDPENLIRFLDYAYTNYPADIYSLILWDHGNGPIIGYGMDKKFGNDSLTLPEIGQALEASPFSNDNRLAFIGFDACLMSSVELANVVDDYADVMIASQETEPSYGWHYDFLTKCLELNTNELASYILSSYVEYDRVYSEKNPLFANEVTLAAVDLAYAQQLEEKINNLFKLASNNVGGNFVILAESRLNTRGFGRATTGSEYDLVDITDLMEAMGTIYPDECAEISSVLEKMIIDNQNNTVRSCGISLYYPYYNKGYYEKSWKDEYSKLGILPDYITYLDRYDQVWLGTDMKDFFDETLTASEKSNGVYSVQMSAEQIERIGNVGYYILKKQGENDYQAIYYSRNTEITDNSVNAYFDNKVIYLTNDYGNMYIPYMIERDTIDDITTYSMFPSMSNSTFSYMSDYYDELEEQAAELQITVNNKTKEVRIIGLYERTEDELKSGKKTAININDYPIMYFQNILSRLMTRDSNGRILHYADWTKDGTYTFYYHTLADGYSFTYEPLYNDGNEYFLMFNIQDVQGNRYGTELMPIILEDAPQVDNPEYDTVEWGDEDEVNISSESNVNISLVRKRLSNSLMDNYYFKVENNNNVAISFETQDMLLNGEYSIFNIDAPKRICIGEHCTEYISIDAINSYVTYGGAESVDSLSFRYIVKNLKTYGRLYDYKYADIVISHDAGENTLAEDNVISSTVLFEDSVAKVEMIERANPDTGRVSYIIKGTNYSDSTICLYIGGYIFNDEFEFINYNSYDSMNCDKLYIDADSYKYLPLYEVEESLFYGDIDDLISMNVTVAYDLDDQHSLYLSFDDTAEVGLICEPYMGAVISEQVLADNDRVKITLLHAGNMLQPSASGRYIGNDITFVVKIENKTGETIPVLIDQLIVNGATVSTFDWNSSYASDMTYLAAGKTGILVKSFTESDFTKNYIDGIESLSMQIMTADDENTSSFGLEGGDWYEIRLDKAGKNGMRVPDKGKLVYSDDWLDLYLMDIEADYDYFNSDMVESYTWKLCAVNKSGKNISVRSTEVYINGVDTDVDECDYPAHFVDLFFTPGVGAVEYKSIKINNTKELTGPAPVLSCDLIVANQGSNELYYEIDEEIVLQ